MEYKGPSDTASFDTMLCAFNKAWDEMNSKFAGAEPHVIERARSALAQAIVNAAANGDEDIIRIKNLALQRLAKESA